MTSQDVRSILNLPLAGPSTGPAPRKPTQAQRKPEGISRELYALIGDNAPSLAEAQASISAVKYRDRPKLKAKKVKWEQVEFTPVARRDSSLVLKHWSRVTDDDPNASVEYFGRFNIHGPSIMEYSQYEYDQHLGDPDWTAKETGYLFDLLREYDLRFVVVADRYEFKASKSDTTGKRRSVEEIKDRYYTICRRLVRTRTATDPQAQQTLLQQYAFDKAREVKRKQYASELFHLTAAEIAEEEALYVEVKRLGQNERRYRADRDDLMRTVIGLDSGLISLDQSNSEGVLNVDRGKKKRKPEDDPPSSVQTSPVAPPAKKQKEQPSDTVLCIYRVPPQPTASNSSHLAVKHPVHQPVQLRSSRLPKPKASAEIRITELLTEMGINHKQLVMPTQGNLDILERVLQAAGGLVDMKKQVDRVEQELRTLKAQKEGFVPSVEGVRKHRSESVASTETTGTNRRGRVGGA